MENGLVTPHPQENGLSGGASGGQLVDELARAIELRISDGTIQPEPGCDNGR